MKRFYLYAVYASLLVVASAPHAQGAAIAQDSLSAVEMETVYITPTPDGFEVYLAAAMHKKEVPLTVVNKPEGATYILTASSLLEQQETTGSKVARCLFAYCAGIEDKASTAVQVADQSGAVLWSYAVNKQRGAKNRQSMAEAVAKHLGWAYRTPAERAPTKKSPDGEPRFGAEKAW
ncbi:MAG TPA: hypothetical protein VFV95_15695 [Vicinamibacterales bacterium]|nr:hypothetical protein [Vicinamibacterales bacterium]